MERRDCDAVVLFGATGDLCYRKIYPALYHLVRRGLLNVPIIGVARQGWDVGGLVKRVRESLRDFVSDADEAVVKRLAGLLRYVDGDYNDRRTFEQLPEPEQHTRPAQRRRTGPVAERGARGRHAGVQVARRRERHPPADDSLARIEYLPGARTGARGRLAADPVRNRGNLGIR